MLVITQHLAIRVPLYGTAVCRVVPKNVIAAFSSFGYESVFVFFVISGFLITGKALERWPAIGHPDMRDFYVQRYNRIVPCLVFLILILSALDLLRLPDYTIDTSRQSLWRAILAAFGLHLNWYEAQTGYLPGNWDVLWSLSIEEAFYIGFPLICLLARRSLPLLVIALFVLAVSLPMTRGALAGNEIWQEKAYLPGMAAIAAGVLAALAAARLQPACIVRHCCQMAGSACCLCVLFGEDVLWPRLGQSTNLVLTGGAALLLYGLSTRLPDERRPLRAFGWLRHFGRLSYEVYLSHMAVVFAAVALWRGSGGDIRLGYLVYPPVLAVALGLGWVFDRIVRRYGGFMKLESKNAAALR